MVSQKLNKLELEIAQLLLDKLEHLEVTPEQVSQIAKFTLQALPDNLSDEQIDNIIPSLDDHYTELASVVLNHLKVHEEATRDTTTSQAQLLIKQGKIDEANNLMNQYFANKKL